MGKDRAGQGEGESKITKADYEAQAAFRYALRQFLSASEQRARASGLTIQQYLALLAIKGYPDRDYVTIGELAERLQIRHHSAVGLVDRLVAQSLVSRQPAPQDRRQVFVNLTSRGEEILERLARANRKQLHHLEPLIKEMLENLNQDEEGESSTADRSAGAAGVNSRTG